MKELSIEEKAKAYDDALKYAKIYYTNGDEDMKMMMKTCFPVLVEESEGEKIRKVLIFHYQGDGCLCTNEYRIDYKDIRAWLEKQGEHANFRNNIQIGDKVTRNEDGVLVNLSQLNRVAKKVEKQGEQKPILDVEIPFGAKDSELKEVTYDIPKGYHAEIEGNNVVIKKGEQNPEWSEEDEYCVHQLIVFCENCVVQDDGAKRCAHWLKDLKERVLPQKQEWSEEDEENFKGVMDALNFCNHEGVNPYDIDPLHLVSWLKSLRPQSRWKPSDKQMKVLETICRMYNYEELDSLYKDLKKLREE